MTFCIKYSIILFVFLVETILTCHSRKSTQLCVMKLTTAELYLAASLGLTGVVKQRRDLPNITSSMISRLTLTYSMSILYCSYLRMICTWASVFLVLNFILETPLHLYEVAYSLLQWIEFYYILKNVVFIISRGENNQSQLLHCQSYCACCSLNMAGPNEGFVR